MKYVCVELGPVGAYTHCKVWAVYEPVSFFDSIAITRQEAGQIGGAMVGVLAVILAFVMIAKASKML